MKNFIFVKGVIFFQNIEKVFEKASFFFKTFRRMIGTEQFFHSFIVFKPLISRNCQPSPIDQSSMYTSCILFVSAQYLYLSITSFDFKLKKKLLREKELITSQEHRMQRETLQIPIYFTKKIGYMQGSLVELGVKKCHTTGSFWVRWVSQ